MLGPRSSALGRSPLTPRKTKTFTRDALDKIDLSARGCSMPSSPKTPQGSARAAPQVGDPIGVSGVGFGAGLGLKGPSTRA
jgi:hypothetical protein